MDQKNTSFTSAQDEALARMRAQSIGLNRMALNPSITTGQSAVGQIRDAGDIEQLTKMVHELRARLTQSADTVTGIADRVFGPDTTEQGSGEVGSVSVGSSPRGSLEDLRRQLSGLFTAADRLDGEIKRLTSL